MRDGEHAISGTSGAGEYLVSADSAPYDMRLAFPDRITEVEGGSAVRRPGQFPDIVTSLHLPYPKSLAEAFSLGEVGHEGGDGVPECLALDRSQDFPVPPEQRLPLERRHVTGCRSCLRRGKPGTRHRW